MNALADNLANDPTRRAPLTAGRQTLASVTETVARIAEKPTTPLSWYVAFVVSISFTGLFFACAGYLV